MGLLQTWMAKIDLARHSFELSTLSKLLKVFSVPLWLSKVPYVHQCVQYGDSNDVHRSMQLRTTHTLDCTVFFVPDGRRMNVMLRSSEWPIAERSLQNSEPDCRDLQPCAPRCTLQFPREAHAEEERCRCWSNLESDMSKRRARSELKIISFITSLTNSVYSE